jgi:hypothetical protein
MTSAEFLRIAGRRWYVIVAGLALAGLAFVLMNRVGGTYSAQSAVIFAAPGSSGVTQVEDGYVPSLIAFAAIVEREFRDGQPADRLASNDATLFGAGVTKGYDVELPNTGGQWQNSFSQPQLTISVVGPSAAWVRTTMNREIKRVETLADERQTSSGVTSNFAITTTLVPTTPEIQYLGHTSSMRARALAALLGLGLGLSIAAAIAIDRMALRSRASERSPSTNHSKRIARIQREPAS